MPRGALVAAVLTLLLAPSAAFARSAPSGPQTASASLGSTTATLTWTQPDGEASSGVDDLHLMITRGGAEAFSQDLPFLCDSCLVGAGTPDTPPLQVADLDADGEPEVLVDTFSGGAHCCFELSVFGFQSAAGTYGHVERPLGNVFFQLQDLDQDGRTELVTADDRFAYAFTSYAGSAFPPLVLNYAGGQLTDVTRQHLALVRADAAGLLEAIRRRKHGRDDERRGLIAAYVAEQHLLGTPQKGLAELARVRRRGLLGNKSSLGPPVKRFRRALLAFLREHGYR